MELKCLSTGSHGNCYLLKSSGNILILDCGIKINDIITDKFIDSLSNVKACLITHSHKDHNKSEKDIELCGIKTIKYNNVIEDDMESENIIIDNFEILPFHVFHDCICLGFLIRDRISKETLCYATDTYKLPYLLGVDYWLVECNYCEEVLDKHLSYESANYNYIERLRRTHMGNQYLYEYFEKISNLAKYQTKQILLCHQSNSGNYDKEICLNQFKKVVSNVDDIQKNKIYLLGD